MRVEYDHVTHTIGDRVVLGDIRWSLESGLTALVGPNGSGKSTLMRLTAGLVKPKDGEIRIDGAIPFANQAVVQRIGYVPEIDALYDWMTGVEFVGYCGRLDGLEKQASLARAREVLEELKLHDGFDRRISTYSKGMRQRVKLAQALIREPELLILDEPMLGCDPPTRDLIHQYIRQQSKSSVVLMSTHILSEAEVLRPRIGYLNQGKLRNTGDFASIRTQLHAQSGRYRIECTRTKQLARELVGWDAVAGVRTRNHSLDVQVEDRHQFLTQWHDQDHARYLVRGFYALDSDLEGLWSQLGGGA